MLKHIVMAGLLALGGSAFAQAVDQSGANNNPGGARLDTGTQKVGGTLNSADRQFVEKVSGDNLAEIKMAKLALQKSQNPDVKNYAQMIIDDHEKANQQLRTIAQDQNLAMNKQLSGEETAQYDRLSNLSGKQFDDAYMSMMVKEHTKDIQKFQQAQSQLTNPQLQQYVQTTLPVLEKHKSHAQMDMKEMQKNK